MQFLGIRASVPPARALCPDRRGLPGDVDK